MRKLIIGSRGSKLALLQTETVAQALGRIYEGPAIAVKVIHTQGDKVLDVALSKIGDKGLFTKELESALLNREIDLAVHSMKDMPTALPAGLIIGAVPVRENSCDVLVSDGKQKLMDLPVGAKVGTSSLRRQAQLLAVRPDLKVVDLRGNLETRVRKMRELGLDAIVLAWAGLSRMNMTELVTEALSTEIMLPAAGQGALAIEIREDDDEIKSLVARLESAEARSGAEAERAFLAGLGGGCQVPIGALAKVEGDQVRLMGMVAALDGSELIRVTGSGPAGEAAALGRELAQRAIAEGGRRILDAIK